MMKHVVNSSMLLVQQLAQAERLPAYTQRLPAYSLNAYQHSFYQHSFYVLIQQRDFHANFSNI